MQFRCTFISFRPTFFYITYNTRLQVTSRGLLQCESACMRVMESNWTGVSMERAQSASPQLYLFSPFMTNPHQSTHHSLFQEEISFQRKNKVAEQQHRVLTAHHAHITLLNIDCFTSILFTFNYYCFTLNPTSSHCLQAMTSSHF